MDKNTFEKISKKAYELYEKSGRVHGRDLEHWVEAEKTVAGKYARTEISEAGKKVEKALRTASRTAGEQVKKAVSGVRSAAKELKKPKEKRS